MTTNGQDGTDEPHPGEPVGPVQPAQGRTDGKPDNSPGPDPVRAEPEAAGSGEAPSEASAPAGSGPRDARPADVKPGAAASSDAASADFLLAGPLPRRAPARPPVPAESSVPLPPLPQAAPPAPPAYGYGYGADGAPPSPYGPLEYLSSAPVTAQGRPVADAGPADGVRAAAVGLLNLSGLGLGYALTRRWAGLALCVAATAALLLVALPADADGVPGKAVAAYAVFLGLTAVHGAVRALRRPLPWPPKSSVAAVLGVVLLAVPAGGVVLYDGAHDDATQKMLLDRLDTADHLVRGAAAEPFGTARSRYTSALATYRDLYDHHAGSRAAKRVPASLNAYYTAVGAPYGRKQYCDAVEPLQYLRTVPAHFDRKALGMLAAWPDDRLATSLYECAARALRRNASSATAETDFSGLLTTFPTSRQAAEVEPVYRDAIDRAGRALRGSDPCAATDTLRSLSGSVKGLPGKAAGLAGVFAKDGGRADGYVESGTYACGVHQYRGGRFEPALTTIDGFITTYPDDSHVALARKIAIAAEVAQHDPAAGAHLPSLSSGGSIPVTFTNDSPDAVRILYTGPVTGSFTIKGCSDCSVYATEADASMHACKSGGKDYVKKTLHLPAGTTYFLNKAVGDSSTTPASHHSTLQYDYVYTECAYTVHRDFGL